MSKKENLLQNSRFWPTLMLVAVQLDFTIVANDYRSTAGEEQSSSPESLFVYALFCWQWMQYLRQSLNGKLWPSSSFDAWLIGIWKCAWHFVPKFFWGKRLYSCLHRKLQSNWWIHSAMSARRRVCLLVWMSCYTIKAHREMESIDDRLMDRASLPLFADFPTLLSFPNGLLCLFEVRKYIQVSLAPLMAVFRSNMLVKMEKWGHRDHCNTFLTHDTRNFFSLLSK